MDYYTSPKRDFWERQAAQEMSPENQAAVLGVLDLELKRRLSVKETGS